MNIAFKQRDGASGGERAVARLHFHASELREGRDGPLIARHVGHAWVVSGVEYLRLDCAGAVRITFSDEHGGSSAQYGPYGHFSSVNGIVFADHLVLAHLDTRSERWYVISDGGEWPMFSVDPVS